MISDREFTRRMLQTVATVAGVAILLALLWAARDALLLVYISALIAMGLSPLVKLIERPRATAPRAACRAGSRSSSIYAVIVAVVVFLGLLVIPPLVAQGVVAVGASCRPSSTGLQTFLISHKLMMHRVTLEEAVQNAPTGTGGNAVGTVLVAISSLIGGIFGLITDPDPDLLPAARSGLDVRVPGALRAARPPRRRRDRGAPGRRQGERVAARAVHSRRRDGHLRRDRPRPDGRAVLLRHRADRGGRRDDSDRRAR